MKENSMWRSPRLLSCIIKWTRPHLVTSLRLKAVLLEKYFSLSLVPNRKENSSQRKSSRNCSKTASKSHLALAAFHMASTTESAYEFACEKCIFALIGRQCSLQNCYSFKICEASSLPAILTLSLSSNYNGESLQWEVSRWKSAHR